MVQKLKCCPEYDKDLWCGITVKSLFDYNRRNKKAPSGGIYDLYNPDIFQLAEININNIRVTPQSQIRVLVTRTPITTTAERRPAEAAAFERLWGALLRIEITRPTTLAHEVGHIVRWLGDAPGDPFHSADADTLMHISSDGDSPDCQWCSKATKLAIEEGDH